MGRMRIGPARAAAAVGMLAALAATAPGAEPPPAEVRVELTPKMVVNEADVGDPAGLVDEQRVIIGPPVGRPSRSWTINPKYTNRYPFSVHLDLGAERPLSKLWLFDTNGKGEVEISCGEPGRWRKVAVYDCAAYLKWVAIPLDVSTRYLRLTRKSPQANFSEIAVYEYTPEAWRAVQASKAAEAAEKARRAAALRRAMEQARRRPLVDLGEPLGRAYLVDEIDCSRTPPDHDFAESPPGASEVRTVLGRPCRLLKPTRGEAAYFTYRIGRGRLLQPGAAYVLAVDYPEDAPRTIIVCNLGNETIRGFHTGRTVGDAFHAKYVNNLCESIDLPLSGRWETWTHLFRLHDRFPEYDELPRGAAPRRLTPEDGFPVTIVQFSARNMPASAGAAVGRIRLLAVPDPNRLALKVRYPPAPLPRRRLFWREEMADGVLAGATAETRGINDFLDWYRFKAERMRFLGMNTFCKDLLEFGANQGWDPTPLGGNRWVHFNARMKGWWEQIVALMGRYGLEVLPYYEYSGSRGEKGLGYERRCRPLGRSDGRYTHIPWIEKANADLTDPETFEDFRKMLELTVVRLRGRAKFAGIWLRPRCQLPVSFSDAALERFARQANGGRAVTRGQIAADAGLYRRYIAWWQGRRRAFLLAVRDYLRGAGVEGAVVLFTGCPAEPGVAFPSWEPVMVTDRPDLWEPILARPEHRTAKGERIAAVSVETVVREDRYLRALLAAGLDWGGWEVRHARPADDPAHYRDVEGVMFTHAINRLYTVASPRTFDAFRTKAGLAVVRHYALNENMVFDRAEKPKLGYFVADIERAGPACMLAEALAVAHGDPTMIGYLAGGNFARGFPRYVRQFNAAFLALPALPSRVLDGAASDPAVVVRSIAAGRHGTYLAVVNTAPRARADVTVTLPAGGAVTDAATGRALRADGRALRLSLGPFQLRAVHVAPGG